MRVVAHIGPANPMKPCGVTYINSVEISGSRLGCDSITVRVGKNGTPEMSDLTGFQTTETPQRTERRKGHVVAFTNQQHHHIKFQTDGPISIIVNQRTDK